MSELAHRSDEELVDLISKAPEGEMRAFETLVRRYQSKVVANCRYVTGIPPDAEDLAQEVFVKVFFSIDRFERRSTFRTWLHRIKVNHCLNHLKKARNVPRIDFDNLEEAQLSELQVQPAAEGRIQRVSDRRRIEGVLEGMSENLRIPLILRDMDQLSYQEIAESLGLGLSAVKMRIKRARQEFQRRYGRKGEAPAAGATT